MGRDSGEQHLNDIADDHLAELDFEVDVQIDPDNLDACWVEQSSLFGKYSKLQAQAEARVAELEEAMKVRKSIVILKVMDDPKQIGDGKATAQAIEAFYRTDEKYRALKEQWLIWLKRAKMATGAVFAFHQRKASLEGLCTLLSMEYFSGPREPHNLSEDFRKRLETQRDKAKQGVRQSVKERMEEASERRRGRA